MPKAGTTTHRGYGGLHQKLRAQIKLAMAQGQIYQCWRCGELIDPTKPWDLGHDDDTGQWRGPEHRACNRSAGARKRNGELESPTRPRTSRTW